MFNGKVCSQRRSHSCATIFSNHPFLWSQQGTNCFSRKTENSAPILKKHLDPCSPGCLWKINGAKREACDEVKNPWTNSRVAHRLNGFCIPCGVVRTGPRIMELLVRSEEHTSELQSP